MSNSLEDKLVPEGERPAATGRRFGSTPMPGSKDPNAPQDQNTPQGSLPQEINALPLPDESAPSTSSMLLLGTGDTTLEGLGHPSERGGNFLLVRENDVERSVTEDSYREEILLDREVDIAPMLGREGEYLTLDEVAIDDIVYDRPELQIRDHYEQRTLENLEDKIRYERADLPAIVVFLVAGVLYLADGLYRLLAYKRAKRTHIPAQIRFGTLREAILFRFRANSGHGVRLEEHERRRMAKRMLSDAKCRAWGLNYTANYCGLTLAKVKKLWKEMYPSCEYPAVRTVVRNGKIYQMDTSKIGKHKCKEQLPPAGASLDEVSWKEDFEPTTEEVDIALDQLELTHEGEDFAAVGPYPDEAPSSPSGDADDRNTQKVKKPHPAEEAQRRVQVNKGDVFLFESIKNPGEYHVLACADSTDEQIYKVLFPYFLVGLLFLDLPYNRDYQAKVAKGVQQHAANKIDNDKLKRYKYRALVRSVLTNGRRILKDGSAFFVFYGIHETIATFYLISRHLGAIRKLILWVKSSLRQNWSPEFRDGHECAYFGYVGKAIRFWAGTKSQTTVFDDRLFDRSSTGLPRGAHPCPKPVPIIAALIELTLEVGGRVADLMGGSGAVLIAAERTGRLATVVEIRPEFVAVTKEWAEFIGLKCIRTTLIDLPTVLATLSAKKGRPII